jgi:hypothetical protein
VERTDLIYLDIELAWYSSDFLRILLVSVSFPGFLSLLGNPLGLTFLPLAALIFAAEAFGMVRRSIIPGKDW